MAKGGIFLDSSEVHYLTYDPGEIWREMLIAYSEAGGDVLYPGDEKEMLLRSVQSIVTQVFSAVDVALRMDTLRYAAGDYLDIYGEKRGCIRHPALAARAKVKITFAAGGAAGEIAAGMALTVNGELLYVTEETIVQTGAAQEVTVSIICQQTGSVGNSLTAGTQLQLLVSNPSITSVSVAEAASGGQNEEDDDTYRERIRRYGLRTVTTGPATQYESTAMSVSSEIIDARALNLSAGKVGVYLILADGASASPILSAVSAALNAKDVRPLTDQVTVAQAKEKSYTLKVQYAQETGVNLSTALTSAVEEYQAWQDNTIGRAFNPDRLLAMLYQAGATRVVWAAGSAFDGGAVEWTEIDADTRCKGTITLAVMTDG